MRIIVHGPLAQVSEITPGLLVIQVTSVSQPYQNRKGTPRLHRVYLEGEITPGGGQSPSPPTPTAPASAPAGPPSSAPTLPALPTAMPLEVQGGEDQ